MVGAIEMRKVVDVNDITLEFFQRTKNLDIEMTRTNILIEKCKSTKMRTMLIQKRTRLQQEINNVSQSMCSKYQD